MLYARQELWKYRRQFDSCDYEWSRVPFKKLDMAYVEQKVIVNLSGTSRYSMLHTGV